MKRSTVSAAMMVAFLLVSNVRAVTVVSWLGGSGEWDLGSWTRSDTLATSNIGDPSILGRDNGWREGDGGLSDVEILISGAGSDVHYDAEFLGDFHLRSNAGGTGLLRIEDGATLEMESNATSDGIWTEIDAKGILVTGEGSTLSRTATNPANGGGAFVWGSWHNDPGEKMDLQILDGGTVDNSGQMWFGAWDDSEENLDLTFEVGEKALLTNHDYLQGGVSYDQPGPDPDAAINFIYNYNGSTTEENDYNIFMSGHGGKLTVDEGQIKTQVKTGPTDNDWVTTVKSYEDLWDEGLLTALDPISGLEVSGLTGAIFNDYLIVEGSNGSSDYSVINISGAVAGTLHTGDLNGDCKVNALDVVPLFVNWGLMGSDAEVTVVKGDINSGATGDNLIDAADVGPMFAAWTGDPGPASAGSAAATYDPDTGEIIVSIEGVNNWFIESASGSLTGDAPIFGTIPGSLPSDGDGIIGETAFGVATATSHSLGQVAALGLAPGDLTISWNAGLGQPLQTIDVIVIPEPATFALAAFGLLGLCYRRRG